MSRASEAYEELARAMGHLEPGCVGIDLFTEDDLNQADKNAMKPICDTCPLLALCSEYAAIARPKGGYWAGATYRQYNTQDGDVS